MRAFAPLSYLSRTVKFSLGIILPLLALTACSSLGESLGYTKNPPDEFNVITKKPLVIPPVFNLVPLPEGQEEATPPAPLAPVKEQGLKQGVEQGLEKDVLDNIKDIIKTSPKAPQKTPAPGN